MNYDFTSYEKAVATAASKAERALAELVTFDGSPKFEPETQAKFTGNALAPLRAEVQSAYDLATAALAAADTLDAASYNDPMTGIDDSTLQRMAALAPFVKEELEGSTPIGLADRLRGVVNHGDPALQRLYLRYTKIDLARPGAQQVAKLLQQLDEVVNGKQRAALAADLEKAQKLRSGAIGLRSNASDALGRVDGTHERLNRERLQRAGGTM